PGATLTCTATYVTTQADLEAESIYNAAAATSDKTPPKEDDETVTPTKKPALTIDKMAVLDDTNGNEVGDVGEELVYEFLVTNSGNVTLTDVMVDDPTLADMGLEVVCDATELAPGEETVCESDVYVITAEDAAAGSVYNEAVAKGKTPEDTPVVSPPDEVTVPVVTPVVPTPTVVPTPPVATPPPAPVPPASAAPQPPLAFTGVEGVGILTALGATLLALGGLVIAATRRREGKQH
ncbi:MAG: hypothetical protein LWW86_14895, partial [Micrococcales bacterium]|nr:hypothetical protein [Micrococcales bacterium]